MLRPAVSGQLVLKAMTMVPAGGERYKIRFSHLAVVVKLGVEGIKRYLGGSSPATDTAVLLAPAALLLEPPCHQPAR